MLKKIFLLLMLVLPMSVFAQKFGHFNAQEILAVMPETQKAQTDIDTMRKQYEDEIKRTEDEVNKKFAAYQQEQANLPKNIQERRQKELQDLAEKGMQYQRDAQQELERSWMEMLEPIYKKLNDAVKAVGDEGGYVYLFDISTTQIPYVNETLSTNVSAAIKAKLGIQ